MQVRTRVFVYRIGTLAKAGFREAMAESRRLAAETEEIPKRAA